MTRIEQRAPRLQAGAAVARSRDPPRLDTITGAAVESAYHRRAGGRPSCARLHPTTGIDTPTV